MASFGKTYVWVGGRRVELPGYVAGRASGRGHQPRCGKTCPSCFLHVPVTGICDNCD